MKTDTQIMNELAINSGFLRAITSEEANNLKALLLDMYKDISSLCDKNKLTYMLGGGSCLGTIRHNGFIPWDDDLDLMMPRESYNKFIDLLSDDALDAKYEYSLPNKITDCKNTFMKVYRKGSFDVEIINECIPGPQGIYIDIFPMDYAPANMFLRKIKGIISDFLHAVCSCVLYSEYPSQLYKKFMLQSSEGKVRYRQRILLGHIFGIIPHRKWVWWFDRWNSSTKDTGYMTIPAGRKHYMGECRSSDTYLPVAKAKFEGIDVNIPNKAHDYLTSMYNNYMEIPPVEKRERHFVYKFKLPES